MTNDNLVPATPTRQEPPLGATPPPLPTVKRRRRFTILEKLAVIRNVRRKMGEEGLSQRAACEDVNIHHTMFGVWVKQLGDFGQARNNKSRSLCSGRISCLAPFQNDLLRFIFELREQGMAVSINMVKIKAAQLSTEFEQKSECAQYNTARRFVRSNGLVFRLGTNESQRSPTETAAEAIDFMMTIARPKVNQPHRHPDFIINMDQTPIPFTFNSKSTLETAGRRTVHIRKSTNDTKRATFAMTTTASGLILKPLLVFKGAPKGRIARKEFPNFPPDMIYTCQGNAWMDEGVMLTWVEQVLKPHVMTAPEGVIPILFLDSYRAHMMTSVVKQITALGVEVEHIPGGCTGLCQPVDIGVNKPFKHRIRQQWEQWMIDIGLQGAQTCPPSREDIVKWTLQAKNEMPRQIVINSWRHGEYTWFPEN
jgi:hypothetical protein